MKFHIQIIATSCLLLSATAYCSPVWNNISPMSSGSTITPNGGYVGGSQSTLTPNGGYVGGSQFTLTPNGGYVGGSQSTLAPNGSYVGGSKATLCPDGSYVSGSCHLQPNGSFTGD